MTVHEKIQRIKSVLSTSEFFALDAACRRRKGHSIICNCEDCQNAHALITHAEMQLI